MMTMMMVGIDVSEVIELIGIRNGSVSARDGPVNENADAEGERHPKAGETKKFVAVVPRHIVTTRHIWHTWPLSLLEGVSKEALSWKVRGLLHDNFKNRHAKLRVLLKACINKLGHKLPRLIKELNSSREPSATFRNSENIKSS